jgi:hypothetical protein
VAIVMAGGYGRDLYTTAQLHAQTLALAWRSWQAWQGGWHRPALPG